MQASLDYAQSLLKAKDLTEVMRLHSEYVQGQMRALAEQASEMGQVVSQGRDGRGQAEKLNLRQARRQALGPRRASGPVKYAAMHRKLHCVAQN